jgi:Fur family peroxide stress response transcriptional regulator
MKRIQPRRRVTRPSRRTAAEVARSCARFTAECRGLGIRITAQRVAVFRAVVEDLSHPTAEAVHRRIVPVMESMSLATVYRTLESLVEAGLLRKVSTPESISRFDANLAPHQHLVCRSCGLMQDWDGKALRRIRVPRATLPGFRAESFDIRIIGLCPTCVSGSEAPLRGGSPRASRSRNRKKSASSTRTWKTTTSTNQRQHKSTPTNPARR